MNSFSSRLKPISHSLLSLSSTTSQILCISLFSTSSSSSYSSPFRRQDEESRSVRIAVWWDIENCGIPAGINAFKIAQSITSALRVNGIKGPVQISAFGDVFRLPKPIQEGLSITGVNLVHVPNGGKNSADRSILMDVMFWVSQNPPPAHIFLISDDRDFAGVLHRLRMNNYNILFAGVPSDSSAVLYSASSIMWNWSELARGENLSGRRFNQPPDGPFNSLYGHYRGPLEDPFELPAPPKSSTATDSSDEEMSSDNVQSVPKAVLKKIHRIVCSYPYGVSSTELRAQLTRSQVNLARDYYGYNKFTRFLMSIPNIVKTTPAADGQLVVYPVSSKIRKLAENNDNSDVFMSNNRLQDVQMNAKASNKARSITRMTETEPMLPVSPYNDVKEKALDEKVEETTGKNVSDTLPVQGQAASSKKLIGKEALDAQVVKSPKVEETAEKLDSLAEDEVFSMKELHGNKTLDGQVDKSPVAPSEKNPKSETGFFKRLWSKWFRGSTEAESTKLDILDEFHVPISSRERSSAEEVSTKSNNQHESMDAKSLIFEKSGVGAGFVAKMISWFRPWKNESPINSLPESSSQELSLIEDSRKDEDGQSTRTNELFSDESFWSDIKSFLRTYSGSQIVMKSKSREEFARKLQDGGPLVVQSLQGSDLLLLVDLLISEKKWLLELPSKRPHFRNVLSPEKSSVCAQLPKTNGLSSIFSSPSHKNHPLRVSSIVRKKPSEKSRVEILEDCKKLLDELLKQHPEGFKIGCFKNRFLEKYGYTLDCQKLGYPKLPSLLRIMPGVKVEYYQVLPDSVVYAPDIGTLSNEANSSGSDGEMVIPPRKHEDIESPWEELGPVSGNSNLSEQEGESDQDRVNHGYEPCAAEDDELSDPEEEASSTHTKEEEQCRSRVNEDESSLLQILDSWYSSKDEISPRAHASNLENSGDRPDEESESSRSSHIGDIGDITSYHAQKRRSRKSYKFVSESEGSNGQSDKCRVG